MFARAEVHTRCHDELSRVQGGLNIALPSSRNGFCRIELVSLMQTGALRDNGHRAVLIGDSNTYGKGKVRETC
jgi:hypothetical protein